MKTFKKIVYHFFKSLWNFWTLWFWVATNSWGVLWIPIYGHHGPWHPHKVCVLQPHASSSCCRPIKNYIKKRQRRSVTQNTKENVRRKWRKIVTLCRIRSKYFSLSICLKLLLFRCEETRKEECHTVEDRHCKYNTNCATQLKIYFWQFTKYFIQRGSKEEM